MPNFEQLNYQEDNLEKNKENYFEQIRNLKENYASHLDLDYWFEVLENADFTFEDENYSKLDRAILDNLYPDEIEDYDEEEAMKDIMEGVWDEMNLFENLEVEWEDGDFVYKAEILLPSDPKYLLLDAIKGEEGDELTEARFSYLLNPTASQLIVSRKEKNNNANWQANHIILDTVLNIEKDLFAKHEDRKKILGALLSGEVPMITIKKVRELLLKYIKSDFQISLNNLNISDDLDNNEALLVLQNTLGKLREKDDFLLHAKITIGEEHIKKDFLENLEKEASRSFGIVPLVRASNNYKNKTNYIVLEADKTVNYKLKNLQLLNVWDIVPIILMEYLGYAETSTASLNINIPIPNLIKEMLVNTDDTDEILSTIFDQIQYSFKIFLQQIKDGIDLSFIYYDEENVPQAYLMSYLDEDDDFPEGKVIYFHDIVSLQRRKGLASKLLVEWSQNILADQDLRELSIQAQIRGTTMLKALLSVEEMTISSLLEKYLPKKVVKLIVENLETTIDNEEDIQEILENIEKYKSSIVLKPFHKKIEKLISLLKLKQFLTVYEIEKSPELEEAIKTGKLKEDLYDIVFKPRK